MTQPGLQIIAAGNSPVHIKGFVLPSFSQGKWCDHEGNTPVATETSVQVGDEIRVTENVITMLRPQVKTSGQPQPLWFIVKLGGSISTEKALQLDRKYEPSPILISGLLFGKMNVDLDEHKAGHFKVTCQSYAGAIQI
jgi:hypothetical protein